MTPFAAADLEAALDAVLNADLLERAILYALEGGSLSPYELSQVVGRSHKDVKAECKSLYERGYIDQHKRYGMKFYSLAKRD